MRESRRIFLEESALRAAKAKRSREGEAKVTKDEFLSLRIQIMEPLLRVLLALVGAFVGAMAFWLHREVGNLWLTVFIAGVAVVLIAVAAVGKRETVEDALSEFADFVFQRLDDAL
jgi:hypothetical protein